MDPLQQHWSLEGHELFTQLCAAVYLKRLGHYVFYAGLLVPLEKTTVRIFRDRLREMAHHSAWLSLPDVRHTAAFPPEGFHPHPSTSSSKRILWIDAHRKVGLQIEVREREHRNPVITDVNEDIPLDFDIKYQCEFSERIIRGAL